MKLTQDQKNYFQAQSKTKFRILSDSLGDGIVTGQEIIDCMHVDGWDITDYQLNTIYDVLYEPERLGGNVALAIVGSDYDDMAQLTQDQLAELAELNNWTEVCYDNHGILVQSLTGGDDAMDWMPVSDEQIAGVVD